jgi:hypothetical protein
MCLFLSLFSLFLCLLPSIIPLPHHQLATARQHHTAELESALDRCRAEHSADARRLIAAASSERAEAVAAAVEKLRALMAAEGTYVNILFRNSRDFHTVSSVSSLPVSFLLPLFSFLSLYPSTLSISFYLSCIHSRSPFHSLAHLSIYPSIPSSSPPLLSLVPSLSVRIGRHRRRHRASRGRVRRFARNGRRLANRM